MTQRPIVVRPKRTTKIDSPDFILDMIIRRICKAYFDHTRHQARCQTNVLS